MADLQQLLRNVSLEESTAHLVRDAKDAQREFMAEHGCRLITAVSLHCKLSFALWLQSMAVDTA